MIPVELGDERLLLRAPTLTDVADIARICRDPEIPRWIGSIPLDYTVEDARWFLTQMVEPGWESGHSLVWLITDRATGDPYGTVGLHQREQGVAEVGFLLAAWARGHGYMTDAVQLVCEYGFAALGLSRIEWQAVVGNAPSRAVAERAGFTFEGVLRGRLQQHDGSGSGERVAADAWIGSRLAPGLVAAPSPPDVHLREGDIVLRPWQAGDADAVLRACQDPAIQRRTRVPVPYTRRDAETFVIGRTAAWHGAQPSFAAVDADNGELLGSFGVVAADEEQGPEVGYWVVPWARGRGVATRSLRGLCRWLLEQGAPRIRWQAEVGNIASLRVAEAVGFTVEGTARRAIVSRDDDKRTDTWVASLLPGELREAEAAPVESSHPADGGVVLHEGNITLRPWSIDDLDHLVRAHRDHLLQTTFDDPVPYTRSDAEDFIASRPGAWAAGCPSFAVVESGSQQLLGSCEVLAANSYEGPEVGYWLASWARGNGFAEPALRGLCRWLFDTGAPRIRWDARVGNLASLRTAEAVGFVVEGVERAAFVGKDGRHDKWTGSLLPGELREADDERPRESGVLRTWSVEPVRLTTSRLALRGLLPADADWVWELARDPVTQQWSPMAPATLDAAREFVRARSSWGAGRATWAIIRTDGTPVGSISLHQVSVENLSAEVGYRVLPSQRGSGYAAEAVAAVTTWAFDALDLQRVALLHASGNTASCRIAERAGYAFEGELRRSYRYGDGKLHDEHVHARLATD